MKKLLIIIFFSHTIAAFGQAWSKDIVMCTSPNGVNWINNTLLVDSAGVPSLVMDTNNSIYCAFQWFPPPNLPSNLNYDKVAIIKSIDNGITWTSPTIAVFNGLPLGYKRPFDPTLVLTDDGKIRMYFSSSKYDLMMLDSTFHTYSAISDDGFNYTYEPGVRVLVADSINIDPAVVKFGSTWHYADPMGPPQAGAFHFTSTDGLFFLRTGNIASDNNHNWTGNFMIDGNEMRFYGTGNPTNNPIWYNSTSDGINWNGFQNCFGTQPVLGQQADPSVIKISSSQYLMVYVGDLTSEINESKEGNIYLIYPNPTNGIIQVRSEKSEVRSLEIFNMQGKQMLFMQFNNQKDIELDVSALAKGIYMVKIQSESGVVNKKLVIQ